MDGVLQLMQTPSHDDFGMPVALLLVVELLARFFGGWGSARLAPERAVGHRLTPKPSGAWQWDLSRPGTRRWRGGSAHLGTIGGEAVCAAANCGGARG